MHLILGGINGHYLRNITEQGHLKTEHVKAAVAYASQGDLLFEWCWDNQVPLHYWGRFDDSVPVSISILKTFLNRASPNFTCKLVKHLHAKVIWWRGLGAYIGSANLSDRAWYNNVEAGCFFGEDEMEAMGIVLELDEFFRVVDQHASPLNEEVLKSIEGRARDLEVLKRNDKERAKRFYSLPSIQDWRGLVTTARKKVIEERRSVFLKEWFETLQILREISIKVSSDENRPKWIKATTPRGSQADQFLHAHYYNRTFEKRIAKYEDHYNRNKNDPETALNEAVRWWQGLDAPPSNEDITLYDWAPYLRDMLSEARFQDLKVSEFEEVCLRNHAIRDHARRVANRLVGLAEGEGQYSIEEKTRAFAKFLYASRSEENITVLETIDHVLYGGNQEDIPLRLWDAVTEPSWRIDHLGISALGELVGWVLPNKFPPRNGRTSKALRSLGFDVTVHSE